MTRSKVKVSGQKPPLLMKACFLDVTAVTTSLLVLRLRCLCTADPDSSVQTHEFEELEGESFWETMKLQPSDQLNVVICYTSKCMPCKLCKPIMADWEQELKQMNKMARFYQFALTMPNKDTALAMDVRSSPTFLVIRDGSIVKRAKGKVNLDEIKSYVFANAV